MKSSIQKSKKTIKKTKFLTMQEFYVLYNKNSPNNAYRKEGNIDARLFLRDLSLPLAYLCAKYNLNANFVTILFLIIGVVSNLLLLDMSLITLFILFLIHEFVQLLDCVDGQLARYNGTQSENGKVLDILVHKLISTSFMLILGLQLTRTTGNQSFMILGSLAAISFVFDNHEHENPTVGTKNFKFGRKSPIIINIINWFVLQIITIFDEVRFYIFALFLMALIQTLIPNIDLIAITFIISAFTLFSSKVVFQTYLLFKSTNHFTSDSWKGW